MSALPWADECLQRYGDADRRREEPQPSKSRARGAHEQRDPVGRRRSDHACSETAERCDPHRYEQVGGVGASEHPLRRHGLAYGSDLDAGYDPCEVMYEQANAE